MASIREHKNKRGELTLTATVRRKGTNQKSISKTFPARELADAWAREIESEIVDSRKAEYAHKYFTVADAIEKYRTDPDVAPMLNNDDQAVLDWWCSKLGRERLSLNPELSLTADKVLEARNELRQMKARAGRGKGKELVSPATVNRRVARLSAVLTFVKDRGWIAYNPARVRKLSGERRISEEEAVLTPDQFNKLVDAAKSDIESYALIWVMSGVAFGPRAGELKNLCWKDVDLEAGMADLRETKNGRSYRVSLGFAAPLYRELYERTDDNKKHADDLVFQPRRGAERFSHREFWDRVRKECGLFESGYRFHSLRHMFATLGAAAGVSQPELQLAMRHQTPAMTAQYMHHLDAEERSKVANLV